MDLGLRGKSVVITGGSAGIGYACAKVMASEGCRVMIVARDRARLDAALVRMRRDVPDVDAQALAADLSSLGGIERLVADAHAALGSIEVLVNNAGSIRAGAFLEIPDEQ